MKIQRADTPPILVAEISANHAQDIELAKATIKAAKDSGANSIKIQTYTPSCLTLDSNLEIFKIQGGLWDGYRLYDLYSEAMLPWEWHGELFSYAKEMDIEIFSSPFSTQALELLENLDCPRYKIASFECIDPDFIYAVASTQKPIILSTGIATQKEIEEALNACAKANCKDITLLQCTSAYPAKISEANLLAMPNLKQTFSDFPIQYGLSDHTLGDFCAILATALGASMIEKHFILDKKIKSPDSSFSMDPLEFSQMAQSILQAHKALGTGELRQNEAQVKDKRIFARSLFITKDIQKGATLTRDCLASLRPYAGLHPRYLKDVLGKKVSCDLSAGTPLSLDHLQD